MSEHNADSPANSGIFAPQDFLSQMQQLSAPWTAAAQQQAQQQMDRWRSASEQLATWQREGIERLEAATDEVGKLVKTSLEYSARLADQARATTVDTARRYLDLVTPRA